MTLAHMLCEIDRRCLVVSGIDTRVGWWQALTMHRFDRCILSFQAQGGGNPLISRAPPRSPTRGETTPNPLNAAGRDTSLLS